MEWYLCLTKHILKHFLTKMGHNLLHILLSSYPQHCLPLSSLYRLKNSEPLPHCPIVLVSDTGEMCQLFMNTDCPKFDVVVTRALCFIT
jgi:hypothetical protein